MLTVKEFSKSCFTLYIIYTSIPKIFFRLTQLYRLPIVVNDGRYNVTSEMVFSVLDVQNTPPMFMGSLTGIVSEDDLVGSKVLTVKVCIT